MAKAKIPVIPIEELTREEKIEKAEKYVTMADNMLMYQWKNKYYNKAMKLLKTLFDEDPEIRERHREIRIMRSTALAEGYIADYEEACRLRDAAKNEDQTRIAIKHFETLAHYMDTHEVRTHLIDPELAKRLEQCSDAAVQADQVRAKMEKKSSMRVKRNIAILAMLLLLCIFGMFFKRTPSFQYVVGRVEDMMGDHTRAWARYKNAYLASGREDWRQLYLDTRYDDGIAAYEAGDLDTAYSDFKVLAVEDNYLDSQEYYTRTEQKLLSSAMIGDTVKFGGGIEWYVLDKEGSRLLLLKKASIPDMNLESEGVWENFAGRNWLNETFIQDTFMVPEQEVICSVELEPSDNKTYGISGGNATTDRVFLLSVEEFRKYQYLLKDTEKMWWLRTPGATPGTLCVVTAQRQLLDYGYATSESAIHLRPAMWVETDCE